MLTRHVILALAGAAGVLAANETNSTTTLRVKSTVTLVQTKTADLGGFILQGLGGSPSSVPTSSALPASGNSALSAANNATKVPEWQACQESQASWSDAWTSAFQPQNATLTDTYTYNSKTVTYNVTFGNADVYTTIDGIPRAHGELEPTSTSQFVELYAEYSTFTYTTTTTRNSTWAEPSPNCTIEADICTGLWQDYLGKHGLPTTIENATEPAITPMPTDRPRCSVGDITSTCSVLPNDPCHLSANVVDLLYWPEVTAAPNASNVSQASTAVWRNITMTSPSVYLAFDKLHAYTILNLDRTCSYSMPLGAKNTASIVGGGAYNTLGDAYTNAVVSLHPTSLSSLVRDLGSGVNTASVVSEIAHGGSSYEYWINAVLGTRVLEGTKNAFHGSVMAKSVDYANLKAPSPEAYYINPNGPYGCNRRGDHPQCSTIFDGAYKAQLKVPDQVRTMRSEWATCIDPLFGAYDPPIALTPKAVIAPVQGGPVKSTDSLEQSAPGPTTSSPPEKTSAENSATAVPGPSVPSSPSPTKQASESAPSDQPSSADKPAPQASQSPDGSNDAPAPEDTSNNSSNGSDDENPKAPVQSEDSSRNDPQQQTVSSNEEPTAAAPVDPAQSSTNKEGDQDPSTPEQDSPAPENETPEQTGSEDSKSASDNSSQRPSHDLSNEEPKSTAQDSPPSQNTQGAQSGSNDQPSDAGDIPSDPKQQTGVLGEPEPTRGQETANAGQAQPSPSNALEVLISAAQQAGATMSGVAPQQTGAATGSGQANSGTDRNSGDASQGGNSQSGKGQTDPNDSTSDLDAGGNVDVGSNNVENNGISNGHSQSTGGESANSSSHSSGDSAASSGQSQTKNAGSTQTDNEGAGNSESETGSGTGESVSSSNSNSDGSPNADGNPTDQSQTEANESPDAQSQSGSSSLDSSSQGSSEGHNGAASASSSNTESGTSTDAAKEDNDKGSDSNSEPPKSIVSVNGAEHTVAVENGVPVFDGTTLSAGGPAITANGQVVSAGDESIAIGSQFIPMPTQHAAPSDKAPAAVFTANGQTFTASLDGENTVIAFEGTTVSMSGPALTTQGITISGVSSGIVIDKSTISLEPASPATDHTVLNIGSDAITASVVSSGAYAFEKTTLTAGGSAASISGHPVSAGSSGLVVDGSAGPSSGTTSTRSSTSSAAPASDAPSSSDSSSAESTGAAMTTSTVQWLVALGFGLVLLM